MAGYIPLSTQKINNGYKNVLEGTKAEIYSKYASDRSLAGRPLANRSTANRSSANYSSADRPSADRSLATLI